MMRVSTNLLGLCYYVYHNKQDVYSTLFNNMYEDMDHVESCVFNLHPTLLEIQMSQSQNEHSSFIFI